ncbi:unnamed protein product [Ostreobium quekettii]|uniref:Signal recognition particle 14 kDa protein n=1 Tax=Ostreobium quekettii TaxID=121088 RepID=A0A8S1IM53_9CHLO|nr:unnamed protein product [Ostreobium quekettii]|eukprot:evm.model.scf_448.4 EVM.evm.TU.scf_448.4   scf_448:60156-61665(+)
MVLLSPDSFLNQLTRMYSKHRNSGSVFVTTKRSNMKSPKYREKAKEEDYACLVRASDGKNTISTVVSIVDCKLLFFCSLSDLHWKCDWSTTQFCFGNACILRIERSAQLR